MASPNSITTVEQALALAEHASPQPQRAHEALQVLKRELYLRLEQRTALSFRLQDLRDVLKASGVDESSELYTAMHDVLSTAEAWMEPETLSEAAKSHIDRLKRENQRLHAELHSLATPTPLPAFGTSRD